ncbi:MAG: nucleotidyltransferase domain-containing protein [Roseiflexaceae bacterium]
MKGQDMDAHAALLAHVTHALQSLPCIDAVVLGGSQARGTATPTSDIDIGIYYGASAPLDQLAINAVAQQLDDTHRANLVTAPGGWGPWVNAGGWLIIDGIPVDIILRETNRVRDVIAACEVGHISAHYQPGHPHAYINAMYMGELAVCRLLWDADGTVRALKARAERYPAALRSALLDFYGFEAGFSASLAGRYATTQDTYYVAAHVVRAISALNQVLFAYNEHYCINEKRAVMQIETFAHRPQNYQQRVNEVFVALAEDMVHASALLQLLVAEVQVLAAH